MDMVEAQEDTTDGDGAKVTVFVFRDGKATGCGKEWDNGRGDFVGNDAVGGGDEMVGGCIVFVEPSAQGNVGLTSGTASCSGISGSDLAEDLVGRDLEGCRRSVGGRSDRTAVSRADLWWWCRGGGVTAALDDGMELRRRRNGGPNGWVEFT